MKAHTALVCLAVFVALAEAQSALPAVSTFTNSQPRRTVSDTPPASLSAQDLPEVRHRFPVSDEKGLLLTCIAPEIDTNKDTDIFKNCSLAPGRTLDDVMHSFIRAIHQEQRERAAEPAPAQPSGEEKADGKTAQK